MEVDKLNEVKESGLPVVGRVKTFAVFFKLQDNTKGRVLADL